MIATDDLKIGDVARMTGLSVDTSASTSPAVRHPEQVLLLAVASTALLVRNLELLDSVGSACDRAQGADSSDERK
jgi:hypothetical protein